jgi:hypothetical protein
MIRHLLQCTRGAAAVEAVVFAPIFLALTLGITDLGSGMFIRMTVNAAAQAGGAYAVRHSCGATCLSAIKTAMNDATGNPSFCTGAVCTASMSPDPCTTGSVCIITVTANYSFSPILPDVLYSWAQPTTFSSTATARIQ